MSSEQQLVESINPFSTSATNSAKIADKSLSESLKKELYGNDIKKEVEETLKALSKQANDTGKVEIKKSKMQDVAKHIKKSAAALPLLHQELTTDAFIAEKREIGLVRMSLAAKRKEIQKLELEVARAEKRLRQQQEQLASTRDKFNNYLKHSTLEQDAAVRRADLEAKAREEKTIEIKRLSALINRTEASIKKIELRLESCYTYKKFLDELTKPRWFYDVLIKMKVEKAMKQVILRAEATYEERAEQITLAYNDAVQARIEAERSQRESKEKGKRGSMIMTDLARSLILSTPIVPLEEQLHVLHATMEQEVQQKVDTITDATTKEVDALTLNEVRMGIEQFCDDAHAPTYFTEVDQLLEVFINVEEGNLFLIQNCQELEEELEGIALNYLNEKEDMESMTRQRHAQMEALANKIRTAQGRLRQLEDRTKMLDASSSLSSPTTSSNNNTSNRKAQLEKGGKRAEMGEKNNSKENATAFLSPEEFKKNVEESIAGIFRTLTAGDNYFKALTAAHHQLQQQKEQQQQQESHEEQSQPQLEKESPATNQTHDVSEQPIHNKGTLVGKGNALKNTKALATHDNTEHKSSSNAGKSTSCTSPRGNVAIVSVKAKVNEDNSDAGTNMGPIDMLTIIENKLEEYHRIIVDPSKNVDLNLITNVMKQSDKERRRQARQEHMIQQAAEQEERVRKALLRSQAPIIKRTGKPVLPRSHLPTTSETNEYISHNSSSLYSNGAKNNDGIKNNNFCENSYNKSKTRTRHINHGNMNKRSKIGDANGKSDNVRRNNDDDVDNDNNDDDDGEEFFR